jgi:hypothetical protein
MDKLIDVKKCSFTVNGIEIKPILKSMDEVRLEMESLKHEQILRINSDNEVLLKDICMALKLYYLIKEKIAPNKDHEDFMEKCYDCIFYTDEYSKCLLYDMSRSRYYNKSLPCNDELFKELDNGTTTQAK